MFKTNKTSDRALKTLINSSKHIFLTGKAGTGKSTLIRKFSKETKDTFAITAPTGVAAINIEGETIHSFFGFKPSISENDAKKFGKMRKNNKIFCSVDTIIVDEVSMVRADLLDCVDIFLRNSREIDKPFGGARMILVGDVFQLPPVVGEDEKTIFNSKYKSPYFFSSNVFKEIIKSNNLEYIELNKIYRQEDVAFKTLLNKIRQNKINKQVINSINKQYKSNTKPDKRTVYLTSTNNLAKQINQKELDKLKREEVVFRAASTGDIKEKDYPTDESLIVKEGCRIMFLNNDTNKRWFNGSLGVVRKIDKERKILTVKIDRRKTEVEVEPFTWTKYSTVYDSKSKNIKKEEAGTFRQFPIKHAWAITIHKSQGKSFDKVFIDLGWGAFAHGQTYVALSRCRTLKGISLSKPLNPKDLILDDVVVKFTEYLNKHKI